MYVNDNSEYLTVNVDEVLTLKAKATGGSGEYTYKYAMFNVNTGVWTVIKNFGSVSEYVYTIKEEGTYQIASTVKDSKGNTVATERITIKVVKKVIPKELTAVLRGNGSTENVTVIKGTKFTLNVEANGGSGEYTYKYAILNVDTGKWSILKDFESMSEYVYALNYPGIKQFAVTVKDSAGKTVATNRITVVVK